MSEEIKEILKDALYNGLTLDYCEEIGKYINRLSYIAEERMNTILEIEKYCNNEKDDLIVGGEVCEDILEIIEELKRQG